MCLIIKKDDNSFTKDIPTECFKVLATKDGENYYTPFILIPVDINKGLCTLGMQNKIREYDENHLSIGGGFIHCCSGFEEAKLLSSYLEETFGKECEEKYAIFKCEVPANTEMYNGYFFVDGEKHSEPSGLAAKEVIFKEIVE
jgi:hypothetical protein